MCGLTIAAADTVGVDMPHIDANALGDKRLFFDGSQRKLNDKNTDKKHQYCSAVESTSVNSGAKQSPTQPVSGKVVLRYTGVVSSQRGLQILLNGVPWQPGRLNLAKVRLQPSTQLIEVSTIGGDQYRLLPGDAITLNP